MCVKHFNYFELKEQREQLRSDMICVISQYETNTMHVCKLYETIHETIAMFALQFASEY